MKRIFSDPRTIVSLFFSVLSLIIGVVMIFLGNMAGLLMFPIGIALFLVTQFAIHKS